MCRPALCNAVTRAAPTRPPAMAACGTPPSRPALAEVCWSEDTGRPSPTAGRRGGSPSGRTGPAGVAAVVGEYHSVVARAAAARADALGLPFLCSSAVLDALTEEPTEWVARLSPPQSTAGGSTRTSFSTRPQPHRRGDRAERLLVFGGPHPAGPPRSTRRHRPRTRCAGTRPRGRVRRTGRPSRDGPPSAGRLPRARRVDRQIRPPRPAPRRDHDRCSGRATEFAAWATLLGGDSTAIPFLRYLPGRLGPLGARVATALRERLAEAPSFVGFEGYDPITVLADVLRTHGTDRARIPHIVAACGGRGHPRADPVLPHARHQRLAMGLGRRSRSLIGTRRRPIAFGSFTPADKARRSNGPLSN